jgi:hypothetical protein
MLRLQIWSALVFSLLIMVGCKSMGSGTGASNTGDVHARFTWQQSEATSGTLTAIVSYPSGSQEAYSGKFYQITRDSTVESLGPLWYPWHPGWGGWGYWGAEPDEELVTHYTGRVLANLAGPGGKGMRCQFQLLHAGEGMKGGGEGQCQLSSGQNIRADFPPS